MSDAREWISPAERLPYTGDAIEVEVWDSGESAILPTIWIDPSDMTRWRPLSPEHQEPTEWEEEMDTTPLNVRLVQAGEWVLIDDMLPEVERPLLLSTLRRGYGVGSSFLRANGEIWFEHDQGDRVIIYHPSDVIAWMYIPPLPEVPRE